MNETPSPKKSNLKNSPTKQNRSASNRNSRLNQVQADKGGVQKLGNQASPNRNSFLTERGQALRDGTATGKSMVNTK